MQAAARTSPTDLAGLLALCLFGAGSALAAVTVTGASPFQDCVADNVAGQPGTNYLHAEVEPWVDANPADNLELVAAWQQDRWSNGGARGLVSAWTADGGASWTAVPVPGLTLCTGGPYQRASDPWVAIAPDGTAYLMSLAFMNDTASGAAGANAMLVNRSLDGGRSWSEPVELAFDDDGATLNDKNSMTADPRNSNYIYAVWDRYTEFATAGTLGSTALQASLPLLPGDGVLRARRNLRAARAAAGEDPAPFATTFTGPVYFARTTNGGASWEAARSIHETGANAQTIGNQVVVMPNGHVLDFFTDISASGSTRLRFLKSTDHGATFAAPALAAGMNITSGGTRTPEALDGVRDGNILFDVAVDNANGNLYAVWQDGRWNGIDKVAFTMSNDKGASWSTPIRINLTPYASLRLRNQAFTPSVAVGADRRIHVSYYDFRNDTSDGTEATDYWAISCDPRAGNCRLRANWGAEIRLTGKSFNMLNAPVARGHFLGDYQGLARRGDRMIAVYGVATVNNRTNIVSRIFR